MRLLSCLDRPQPCNALPGLHRSFLRPDDPAHLVPSSVPLCTTLDQLRVQRPTTLPPPLPLSLVRPRCALPHSLSPDPPSPSPPSPPSPSPPSPDPPSPYPPSPPPPSPSSPSPDPPSPSPPSHCPAPVPLPDALHGCLRFTHTRPSPHCHRPHLRVSRVMSSCTFLRSASLHSRTRWKLGMTSETRLRQPGACLDS